jgi:hypothetical protein
MGQSPAQWCVCHVDQIVEAPALGSMPTGRRSLYFLLKLSRFASANLNRADSASRIRMSGRLKDSRDTARLTRGLKTAGDICSQHLVGLKLVFQGAALAEVMVLWEEPEVKAVFKSGKRSSAKLPWVPAKRPVPPVMVLTSVYGIHRVLRRLGLSDVSSETLSPLAEMN